MHIQYTSPETFEASSYSLVKGKNRRRKLTRQFKKRDLWKATANNTRVDYTLIQILYYTMLTAMMHDFCLTSNNYITAYYLKLFKITG